MKLVAVVAVTGAMLVVSGPGAAQTAPGTEQGQEQDSLKIYFGSGSARVDAEQRATLDQAARLFREGSPIVMIVAGGADTVGAPDSNLDLSIQRAQAVADGLVARGIPADRLQVLGRGTSELPVETGDDVDNRENRVVDISWR
jgi:OOP family OmpA-OmpF porin